MKVFKCTDVHEVGKSIPTQEIFHSVQGMASSPHCRKFCNISGPYRVNSNRYNLVEQNFTLAHAPLEYPLYVCIISFHGHWYYHVYMWLSYQLESWLFWFFRWKLYIFRQVFISQGDILHPKMWALLPLEKTRSKPVLGYTHSSVVNPYWAFCQKKKIIGCLCWIYLQVANKNSSSWLSSFSEPLLAVIMTATRKFIT